MLERQVAVEKELLLDAETKSNERYVETWNSLWEIAIKTGKKQLTLQNEFDGLLDVLNLLEIEILTITFTDTQIYKNLPLHHGNSFDRMIISQTINNRLTISGCDQSFNDYPIQILWK